MGCSAVLIFQRVILLNHAVFVICLFYPVHSPLDENDARDYR